MWMESASNIHIHSVISKLYHFYKLFHDFIRSLFIFKVILYYSLYGFTTLRSHFNLEEVLLYSYWLIKLLVDGVADCHSFTLLKPSSVRWVLIKTWSGTLNMEVLTNWCKPTRLLSALSKKARRIDERYYQDGICCWKFILLRRRKTPGNWNENSRESTEGKTAIVSQWFTTTSWLLELKLKKTSQKKSLQKLQRKYIWTSSYQAILTRSPLNTTQKTFREQPRETG